MDADLPGRSEGGPSNTVSGIAEALANRGWSVAPAFLDPRDTGRLACECLERWRTGQFRHARIGHGRTLQLRPEIRNDQVNWLDPAHPSRAQRRYFDALERLRLAINSCLYLGLFEFEGHFTVYSPGASYQRHLDQFAGVRQRAVSCILYLNEDWQTADGGALRLYPAPERTEDVLPAGGTLVSFLSDRLEHEVLPARRQRLSITGWFRTRT